MGQTKRLRKSVLLAGVLSVFLVMAACGNDDVLEPTEVREGIDRCEVCGMLVSNDEHAVQLRHDDGQTKFFDDLGDLFVWTDDNSLDDVNVRYVRDKHTMDWIQIEQATFVYDEEIRTPMGFGVISFNEEADAEAYIEAEGIGTLLSYDDLLSHEWESNMEHHDHGDHDGHEHDDGEHGHGDHDDDHAAEHEEDHEGEEAANEQHE